MALRLLTQLSATAILSTRRVLVVMFIVKYLHDVLYLYSYLYVLVLATTLVITFLTEVRKLI